MSSSGNDRGNSQEFVMTLLAIFGRQFRYELWSGGLVDLLADAGYSVPAARAALNRLASKKLLQRSRSGRRTYYSITRRCADALAEGDRRLFSLGEQNTWDGSWTVVVHTISETQPIERNQLARRLRFLGFRPIQDAIWLSPRTRNEEVHAIAVTLNVQTQVAVLIGSSPHDLAVEQAIAPSWDLAGLCERYQQFDNQFRKYTTGPRRARETTRQTADRDAFLTRATAAHTFRQFALLDPEIPDTLLPEPTTRHRAVTTFRAIMSELEEPANRYFATVMHTPDETSCSWKR